MPHLHPLTADDLRPKPAPQAAAFGTLPLLGPANAAAPADFMLQPAAFAASAPPQQQEDNLLDSLLSFLDEEEDDEDENEPDAVPTESMPVPACVPLFETEMPRRSLFGKKG